MPHVVTIKGLPQAFDVINEMGDQGAGACIRLLPVLQQPLNDDVREEHPEPRVLVEQLDHRFVAERIEFAAGFAAGRAGAAVIGREGRAPADHVPGAAKHVDFLQPNDARLDHDHPVRRVADPE